MVFDIQKARLETPGCFGMVHLHHSGSALMPSPVFDAIRDHLELELIRGGYEAEEEASEKLAGTYSSIARMLNCSANEIALTESATASWNAVFYGIAQTFKEGDRILTSRSEYVSNMIAYLHIAKKTGAQVQIIPDDTRGQLDVRALESMIGNNVKLISVTHVPTHNGLVNPINEVGQIASDYSIPYIVDACQSAGQMPLDVVQIGCDALSATGRKYLRGPRGTGFLYVREQSVEKFPPPFLIFMLPLGPEKTRMKSNLGRAATKCSNQVSPTASAWVQLWITLCLGGLAEIYSRIRFLADKLRELLGEIDGVTLRDKGPEKCGIVTFSIQGVDAAQFQKQMRLKNINVGVSTRNSAVIDLDDWGVGSITRSPVHYYNSEDEIEYFAKEVQKKAAEMR